MGEPRSYNSASTILLDISALVVEVQGTEGKM